MMTSRLTGGPGDREAPFELFTLASTTLTAVFGETLGLIILMGLILALVWKVGRGMHDPRGP